MINNLELLFEPEMNKNNSESFMLRFETLSQN